MRNELERRLSAEIESWSLQPVHASIFGSAARGDGDASSDIDVFIVRPKGVGEDEPLWREQVERLAEDTYRWTGNRLAVSEVGTRELSRLRRDSPPIVSDLRNEAITLTGRDVRRLFGGRP